MMHHHLRTLSLAAFAALAAAACSDDVASPSARSGPLQPRFAAARAEIVEATQGRTRRGFEDEILRLEAQVPGLGGVSMDPATGAAVVYLLDLTTREQAMTALRTNAPNLQVPSSFRAKLGTDGSTVVRQGQFAFSELVAWSHVAAAQRRRGGFLGIDADEGANRLHIAIPEHADGAAAITLLTDAGIPADAIVIENRPVGSLLTNLTDRVRPTGSGLLINNGGTGGNGNCSLGFNVDVQIYGDKGFLTAAHCAPGNIGLGNTGGTMYQNSAVTGNIIGTVQLNPAWNSTSTDCGGVTLCTDADAMFVLASSTSPSDWAKRIASTSTWGSNDAAGSIAISGWWTGISIVPYTYQGATVYKVGQKTGVTFGVIAATCENPLYTGTVVLCEDKVTGASSGPGDSGAAVFYPNVGGSNPTPPYAIGLLSGGGGSSAAPDGHCTAGCYWHFTSIAAAQSHLSRYFTP